MTDTWDPREDDKFSATVEPFHSAFRGWRRSQPVLSPDAYARLLYRYDFADPIVPLIVYPHVLGTTCLKERATAF